MSTSISVVTTKQGHGENNGLTAHECGPRWALLSAVVAGGYRCLGLIPETCTYETKEYQEHHRIKNYLPTTEERHSIVGKMLACRSCHLSLHNPQPTLHHHHHHPAKPGTSEDNPPLFSDSTRGLHSRKASLSAPHAMIYHPWKP
jgi:hypothetical protein